MNNNAPIGIPSGWEEIAAYYALLGPGMLRDIHFIRQNVEPVGEYYLDAALHDWRVVE